MDIQYHDGHTNNVPKVLQQKVESLETEINKRIVSFPTIAKEIELSQEEYEQVIADLDSLYAPMMLKYDKMKKMGYK